MFEARYKHISVQDKGKRFNLDLLEAVELGFLLELAKVMTVAALHREESGGGHFRAGWLSSSSIPKTMP